MYELMYTSVGLFDLAQKSEPGLETKGHAKSLHITPPRDSLDQKRH